MTRRLASIPVDKVRVPKDTLRQLDVAWADTIGAMMEAEGQVQPIEVGAEGDGFVLVFGLHRLEGSRRRGRKTIDALIDEKGGDLKARRRRAIHENLGRSLSQLDRAVHIAELHADLQAETPARRRGGDRTSDQAKSKLQKVQFGLAAEIAERVGLSERTIAIAVSIAHGIGPAVRARLVTPSLIKLADSRADLMLLAAEPDARQSRILDVIASDKSNAHSVADAIAELDGGKKPTETERYWSLAENAFARLQGKTRDRFFAAHERDFLDWQRRKAKR
ncbi:MAG: ParB N-terminal domain-containing protein [Bauldia sp.]